ncbi:MAG: hypothetical protein ACKOKE_04805 [Actinomycetota bacterium]
MTETLFPANGSADRPASKDPLEPLSRLEDQLRRSRERLVEGNDGAADPADAVPAVLAADEPAETPHDEIPAVTAPSPYAALAELTPVHEFAFEPDAPLTPEQDLEDGFVVVALPDMPEPDLGFEIPEIPLVELPEPFADLAPEPVERDAFLAAAGVGANAGGTDEATDHLAHVAEEDDVWQPFPEVRADAAVAPPDDVDMTGVPAAAAMPAAALEQDPLPVPASVVARSAASASTSPSVAATGDEADRALAEAAREVSWLARRVADGLESMTGRLDAFERRFAELADRPATAAASASPAVPAPSPNDPTALEEWSMALARLVRSDSNALRDEVHRIAEEQDVALAEVHRLTEENGARISASVEETIARIDGAVLKLADAIEERLGSAVASLEAAADAMRSEDQETLVRLIDDRMEALARLVRSDNERISARLEAEIGIGREVLRAAKELQASLASDVASALDQRDRIFRASGSGSR